MDSSSSAEPEKMEVIDELVEDEMEIIFNRAETSDSSEKITDYIDLVKNPRSDDLACKIKEQSIYK